MVDRTPSGASRAAGSLGPVLVVNSTSLGVLSSHPHPAMLVKLDLSFMPPCPTSPVRRLLGVLRSASMLLAVLLRHEIGKDMIGTHTLKFAENVVELSLVLELGQCEGRGGKGERTQRIKSSGRPW